MQHFYPRSPCGERRCCNGNPTCAIVFLSTLSLRRATVYAIAGKNKIIEISIHALLAESDAVACGCMMDAVLFLSTLSLRRATITSMVSAVQSADFYPRSPCGERRDLAETYHVLDIFLSTLSLRRATQGLPHLDIRALDFYPRSPCGERP